FDVVRADPVRGASEGAAAIHGELVRAETFDLATERNEKVAKILDVRLARGVPQDCRARGADGGHQRVFGCRDTRLVEEHVGAAEAALLRGQMEGFLEVEGGAEPLEREKMGVDATPSNDVAARRRELNASAANQHRTRQKDR